MECPVCEYPGVRGRYRMRDRFFETTRDVFLLRHCPSCGLHFLDEEALKDRLADFYPSGYWWHGEGGLARCEGWYRDAMVRRDQLKFVLSAFDDPAGKTLLDIGCGGGTFLKAALAAGFDARGLESSPEAASIAESVAPGRVEVAGEGELAERGVQFDALTLFHALEHVPEPFRYLKALRKLLKPEGLLFVQVPNCRSLQARVFGPRWYGLDCPRHLYNYSAFSLLHLLGRAGFRIHRVRHFSPRDNAAALASSLFPGLDPMSQRVKLLRRSGKPRSLALSVKNLVYLPLLMMAQPLAWLEAKLGRGATVTVCASLD